MVFSSLEFLFVFFPLVLIIYFILKPKLRNSWLFLASIIFYYAGDSDHFTLLIFIILIAYVFGLLIQRADSQKLKKISLLISVALMVATMSYYKYWDFMITNINALFRGGIPLKGIVLPIGISFFVFQAISYVVDIYRGEKAMKNPIDMGLYIAFFPQLIAGPIVRFHDISIFMDKSYRKIDFTKVEEGVWRFCIGLCKKVLLANNLGGLAAIVFGVNDISRFSVMYTWLGAMAYTLQIYYDFSGYSDMAIGLGKMFGFEFQENFNYPYYADSIKEFWRRWHISLSQFFRDYVYIPLGGNRCSAVRWEFNMMIVWFLTGLWHGASWNYILWGLVYGFVLLVERILQKDQSRSKFFRGIGHAYTMIIVLLLWVVFRSSSLTQAYSYIRNMFGFGASSLIDRAFCFQASNFAVLIVVASIFSLPVIPKLEARWGKFTLWGWTKAVFLLISTIVSVSYIYNGSYNPFLYFMF